MPLHFTSTADSLSLGTSQDSASTLDVWLNGDDESVEDPVAGKLVAPNPLLEESWSSANFQRVCELWSLTEEDAGKLRALQTNLTDIVHWKNDPDEVIRFLKEFAGGDVDVAERAFRNMIQWRVDMKVDRLLETYKPPDEFFEFFPVAVLKGLDKEGDPILVERTGVSDALGLMQRFGKRAMIKRAIWVQEMGTRGIWTQEYEKEQGRKVLRFTAILDLEGLNSRHLRPGMLSLTKKIARTIQDFYPGRCKRIIVLRAPSWFGMVWKVVKRFFDPRMRKLVTITKPENYLQILDLYVDRKVLPRELCREGRGEAIKGFDPIFKGGLLPQDLKSPQASFETAVGSTNHERMVSSIADRDIQNPGTRDLPGSPTERTSESVVTITSSRSSLEDEPHLIPSFERPSEENSMKESYLYGEPSQEKDLFKAENYVGTYTPEKYVGVKPALVEDRWSEPYLVEAISDWGLTDEQIEKLKMLGHKLSDIRHWKNEPHEVVRPLREYSWDVAVAERNFRKMVQWRIDNKVDTLLEDYTPPAILNYFPVAVLKGTDRDGDPIHLERVGASDSWGLYQRLGREEMVKHAIWIREQDSRGDWQDEYIEKHGRRVKLFNVILDMEGLNTGHMRPGLLPMTGEITKILQENYPGGAKKIIILRAPAIFGMIWSILKHFVQKSFRDVMVFTSSKDYLEVLDQYMDREILPSVLCPEGKGEAVIGFDPIFEGGPIPKDADNLVVKRESSLNIEQEIQEAAQSSISPTRAPEPPSTPDEEEEVLDGRSLTDELELRETELPSKVSVKGQVLSWGFWNENSEFEAEDAAVTEVVSHTFTTPPPKKVKWNGV